MGKDLLIIDGRGKRRRRRRRVFRQASGAGLARAAVSRSCLPATEVRRRKELAGFFIALLSADERLAQKAEALGEGVKPKWSALCMRCFGWTVRTVHIFEGRRP
jgi:hypothetical protein